MAQIPPPPSQPPVFTVGRRACLHGETDHVGTNFTKNVLTAAAELAQRWAIDGNIARETWPRANHIVVLGMSATTKARGKWNRRDYQASVRAALVAVQIWLQNLQFASKTEHEAWSLNTARLAETLKGKTNDIYDWIYAEVSKLIPQWSTDRELIQGVDQNGWDWSGQVEADSKRTSQKCDKMSSSVVVGKNGEELSRQSDVTVLLTAYTMLAAMTRALRNDVPLEATSYWGYQLVSDQVKKSGDVIDSSRISRFYNLLTDSTSSNRHGRNFWRESNRETDQAGSIRPKILGRFEGPQSDQTGRDGR